LRPLADQGNALAQLGLGGMYANGQGVPQDYAQAVIWYRKAAPDDGEHTRTPVFVPFNSKMVDDTDIESKRDANRS